MAKTTTRRDLLKRCAAAGAGVAVLSAAAGDALLAPVEPDVPPEVAVDADYVLRRVVRAASPVAARKLVAAEHDDEGIAAGWQDPERSTCQHLGADGPAGVLCREITEGVDGHDRATAGRNRMAEGAPPGARLRAVRG